MIWAHQLPVLVNQVAHTNFLDFATVRNDGLAELAQGLHQITTQFKL